MEDTNKESETVKIRRGKKRQRYRIRSRKKCPNCGEEYSHSSFYTHKCRTTDDQQDEEFSLQFPATTAATSNSSDSEFYVSSTGDRVWHAVCNKNILNLRSPHNLQGLPVTLQGLLVAYKDSW